MNDDLDDVIKELRAQIAILRDGAKNLTTIVSALPALYFAMLSVSDLRKSIHGWGSVWFLLPAVAWLTSLSFLVFIILPDVPKSNDKRTRQKRLEDLRGTYSFRLRWALICFLGGLILMVVEIVSYLVFVPASP
jgi:hypothetical protein